MAGKTNFLENLILDDQFRDAPAVALRPTSQTLVLFVTLPGEDGTGGVELSMTNYAPASLGAPGDASWKDPASAPQGRVRNLAEIDFGAIGVGGDTEERVIGWGIKDQGANLRHFGVFKQSGASWQPFVGKAGDDVITCIAHGFADTTKVFVRGTGIPSPLAEGVEYFVRDATADTFKLAATSGGAAIDLTANGGGQVVVSGAMDIQIGNPVKVPVNALEIVEG